MRFDAPLVCFDNDGTLFASDEAVNAAIQDAFVLFTRSRGHDIEPPTSAEICRHTGLPGLEFFRALLPATLQAEAAEFRLLALEHEVRGVHAHGRLYDGAADLLRDLRQSGRKLALVTNGGRQYIDAVAERMNYAGLLDAVYHHGKHGLTDKTQMIRRAQADFGESRAVMIGDRRSDLEGARGAGAAFIACRWGFGDVEEVRGADASVATIAELRALLLA